MSVLFWNESSDWVLPSISFPQITSILPCFVFFLFFFSFCSPYLLLPSTPICSQSEVCCELCQMEQLPERGARTIMSTRCRLLALVLLLWHFVLLHLLPLFSSSFICHFSLCLSECCLFLLLHLVHLLTISQSLTPTFSSSSLWPPTAVWYKVLVKPSLERRCTCSFPPLLNRIHQSCRCLSNKVRRPR